MKCPLVINSNGKVKRKRRIRFKKRSKGLTTMNRALQQYFLGKPRRILKIG